DAATLARLRIADRFCADGARLELHCALWRPAGPRAFEAPARGWFRMLLAGCLRSFCGEPGRLRIAAHQELVAADLPAFQPVEKAHAEQARAQLPGLGDERGDRALDDAADRQSVERDRRGAGAAVRGVDVDGIVEDFERKARGLCRLVGEDDCARAGV